MRTLAALLFSLLAVSAVAQPVTVRLDPARSLLAYTGTAPFHDWTGTSRSVSAQLRIDPADPSGSTVVISAPVRSFDSGNGTRDRNMAEATEADRHPRVRFEATGIRPGPDWRGTAAGGQGTWQVTGRLSFGGTTRGYTVPIAVSMRGGAFAASGTFAVSLEGHGVDRPGILGARIGDTITVRLDLRGAY